MGVRDVLKNGYHPSGKQGGKESWRGDFKGVNQVAGWMGKGKDDTQHTSKDHASKPISSLADPSSFGPPPKHRDYYGSEAAASSSQSHTTPVDNAASRAPTPLPAPSTSVSKPAPAVPQRAEQNRRDESPEKPTGPFRVDTTGLSTAGLPPPPQHRDKRHVGTSNSPTTSGSPVRTGSPAIPSNGRPMPPAPPARSNVAAPAPPTKPKPSLPPRVPPRSAVAGVANDSGLRTPDSPPPPYTERAGPVQNAQPAMGELQERFARMRARAEDASSASDEAAPPPIPLSSKPR